MKVKISVFILLSCAITSLQAQMSEPPEILADNVKYLFYLHGKIIEDQGIHAISEEYGTYEYQKIISEFKNKGFLVVSDLREKDTDIYKYSDTVVFQIQNLLEHGVNANNISIVGASKGAVIGMLISSKLKNKNVNYVLIANCNDWIKDNVEVDLHGNILSIYESSDSFGQSCDKIFGLSNGLNKTKELKLNLGIGHGICYKPLKEWINPAVEWAGM